MSRRIERLLFVFDADSGILGATADSIRKLLRIDGCDLCAITHGLVSEKGEMRSCREELGVPVDYLHRDELSPEVRRVAGRLPAVVARTRQGHVLLLDRETIARCRGSVADLRGKLSFHAARLDLELAIRESEGDAS